MCKETVTVRGTGPGENVKFVCPNCEKVSTLVMVPVGTWLMLPPGQAS